MASISFSDRAISDFLELRRLRQHGDIFASTVVSRPDSPLPLADGTAQPVGAISRLVKKRFDSSRRNADLQKPEAVG